MPATVAFEPGGYRYIPGVFQYSAGVAAESGYAIHRISFDRWLPLEAGFETIARHLNMLGRPLHAFCHCELRSPAPFTDHEFRSFNLRYVETLRRWGIAAHDVNPVARSNLCPRQRPPDEPSFYAFSYTVPVATGDSRSFAVAGCGEVPEGKPNYRDYIVRRGEVSESALLEKANFVLDEQERRLTALGFTWQDVSSTNVYTIHHLTHDVLAEFHQRSAAPHGITWHHCRPPVVDVDFEMDCRRSACEMIL